jgi:hypothetical protein
MSLKRYIKRILRLQVAFDVDTVTSVLKGRCLPGQTAEFRIQLSARPLLGGPEGEGRSG